MSHAGQLPNWAALIGAVFVLLGAGLTLVGSFGLFRLRSFYDRMHAPTLGTSWGTFAIVLASMLLASFEQSRLVVHEIVVITFVTVTTPVTLMLLARASLYRDRSEGSKEVPAMDPPAGTLSRKQSDIEDEQAPPAA